MKQQNKNHFLTIKNININQFYDYECQGLVKTKSKIIKKNLIKCKFLDRMGHRGRIKYPRIDEWSNSLLDWKSILHCTQKDNSK